MSRRGQPKNTESKTRDVNAAERVRLALDLCAKGCSWEQVATQAGYASRGAAHNAVMRELGRNISKDVEEWRARELYTLEAMQVECWEIFTDTKNGARLFAADRVLAIMERRAKLLGLDATSQEQVLNQNYTKRIILVAEETHAASN